MTAATAIHPGDLCQHTWPTDAACTAWCAITAEHQCTVDRGTHGAEHVCCCGATTTREDHRD